MSSAFGVPWRMESVMYIATAEACAAVRDRLSMVNSGYAGAGWLRPAWLPGCFQAVVNGFEGRRLGEFVHVRAACGVVELGVPVARD